VAAQRYTVGLGAASHGSVDAVLPLGPHHPSNHGVLQLALTLDGDRIVTAEPDVGFVHRGAEKLFEVRDYRQLMMLANRHDWLSAFGSELGIALAVERMLGMTVPDRAVWLRTLLAELNRLLSHLMFLGATADPGRWTAFAAREQLQEVMEEATGGRLHYVFNRVGGLAADVPAGWTTRAARALDGVHASLPSLVAALDGLGEGVAVLDPALAVAHGVTGPPARASGVDMDLRRDEPYLAYAELPVRVVTRVTGDAEARFSCVLEQCEASLELAAACLSHLPRGPVALRLPKTVRAPEGATYAWTENALGVQGYYLVSRGDRVPWRLAMRTASFNNVSVLAQLLPGTRLTDLTTALCSMFFVIGDIDK